MNTQALTVSLRGAAPDVVLHPYLLDNSPEVEADRRRPLVLILPGGGYQFRSFREAEPIAVRLLGLGLSACVVDYEVAPARFPAALLQVLAAIAHARQMAEPWHIDADKILVMGFSAGGHLAASAGVFWSKPFYAGKLGLQPLQVKPNGLVLGYPVISAGPMANEASFENLLGDDRFTFGETVSLEKQVNPAVPPTFIFHTWDDRMVPVENALLFASALKSHDVSCALHIFSSGTHGISLSNQEVYGPGARDAAREDVAVWVDLFDRWQRRL